MSLSPLRVAVACLINPQGTRARADPFIVSTSDEFIRLRLVSVQADQFAMRAYVLGPFTPRPIPNSPAFYRVCQVCGPVTLAEVCRCKRDLRSVPPTIVALPSSIAEPPLVLDDRPRIITVLVFDRSEVPNAIVFAVRRITDEATIRGTVREATGQGIRVSVGPPMDLRRVPKNPALGRICANCGPQVECVFCPECGTSLEAQVPSVIEDPTMGTEIEDRSTRVIRVDRDADGVSRTFAIVPGQAAAPGNLFESTPLVRRPGAK